jgi:hypothetical protein
MRKFNDHHKLMTPCVMQPMFYFILKSAILSNNQTTHNIRSQGTV